MGDRYILSMRCPKCGKLNEDVYYAPSCGFETFKCQKCGVENEIYCGFGVKCSEEEEPLHDPLP